MTTPTVPTLEKVMTMAATIDPPQQVGDVAKCAGRK